MLVVLLEGQPSQGDDDDLYTLVRMMDVMFLQFRLMQLRKTL